MKGQGIKEYPETHQKGIISLENVPGGLMQEGYIEGDFGIQVAWDGRVWVCINGIAFLRFKPKISPYALPRQAYDEHFTPPDVKYVASQD